MGKGMYEVHSTAKKVVQNVPIQVGKYVLDSTKNHMVRFFHSQRCDIKKIGLMNMDTGSFTMAIAGKDIHDIVAHKKKEPLENIVKKCSCW